MRQDWEYRQLDDVCSIDYGTRVVQKNEKGSTYFVYGGGGATFKVDRYNREDCFIVSRFAMSPKCTRFVSGKFFLNDSGLSVSTKDKRSLRQSFVDKALLANNDAIYAMGKGVAQKNLDMPSFRRLQIPIPPIAEQEKIVAELDCLTGIIDKKKQQLEELDKLAQSIFYDMFGTSLEEKGFPIKMMGEIGTFQRGAGLQKKDFVDDGMPCIHYGQIHTAFGSYTTKHLTTIPKDLYAISKIGHPGDLLMVLTSEDVEGSCKSTAWLGEYDIAVGSDAAIFSNHRQNAIYLSYCTRTRSFFNEKSKYANGFKVTHIKTGDIGKIPIAIPPRALQDLFAQKVEAIEKQKELVKQSILETETLFNSRMDYWFN